ncbi:MAG TPA: DUF2249 domain-containing protein [Candidatus Baltobacteraceae bacterium]|jgi:CRP-like cAMP-binding protein
MSDQRIDLRPFPIWDRSVAMYDAFDALAEGQMLTFVTNNDPRALMTRIDQMRPKQARWHYRRVGEREWHFTLTRLEADLAETAMQSLLRRSFVFSMLDDRSRNVLAAAAIERTARKNDVVAGEDTDFPAIGIVREGVLALTSGSGGRERLLHEIFPYEAFGEALFFDEGHTTGRIVALSKIARYVLVPRAVVREIARQEPALLLAIGECCAQRLRMLAEDLGAQSAQPIVVRVAASLLSYAVAERGLVPSLAPLAQMTQAQLAASAGTVKEVAARAIAELEARGALRRERGHIRYLDRSKLLEIVNDP